jgi:hypothetical protein
MNVLTSPRPAALPAPIPQGEPVGEVRAVYAPAPNLLLLLGWQSGQPPAAGIAQLERRRTDAGRFRCAAWPREGQMGQVFVAAVQLPPGADPLPGQRLALRDAAGPALVAVLPDGFSDHAGFANGAATLLGAQLGSLVRFLLELLPENQTTSLPALAPLLADLLTRAATEDGCIELAGVVADDCAFLQGWGRVPETVAEVVLLGQEGGLLRAGVQVATFPRDDIAAPACGLVMALPATAAEALARLDAVFLISCAGILRRPVLDRRMLNTPDSIGHLRDMLPVLDAPAEMLLALRMALQPRYDGRDTLGALGVPVRATVDTALWHPAGQLYLHGWLFDPARLVSRVSLADGARRAVPLDAGWTRVPRPDVSAAFAVDPAFARPPDDDHGFVVHVAAPLAAEQLHLVIELAQGEVGFVPVSAHPLLAPGGMAAALRTVDLYKPSGLSIIETQLAPFIDAALRREPPAPLAASARQPAGDASGDGLALVVPLPEEPMLPRAFLSQFLRDPLRAEEELLLVAGPGWHRAARDRLEGQARAMGVTARILTADGPVNEPGEVLAVASAASAAAHLLLVSIALIGRTPGWRQGLAAAARLSLDPAAVCPTVLYEDLSIRTAGPAGLTLLRSAPYLRVARELAGLPAAFAGEGMPTPVPLGTLHCCLLPRAALPAVRTTGPTGCSPVGRELVFFLRLHAAGVGCLWAPSVQVFAAEADAAPPTDAAHDPAVLVDLWRLRTALDGAAQRPDGS